MARVRIPSLALCLASAGCLQYTDFQDTVTGLTTEGPTSTSGPTSTTTVDPTPGTVTVDPTTTTATTDSTTTSQVGSTMTTDETTASTVTTMTTTEPPPDCGDGMVEGDEQCDDGADNGAYGKCAADCSGLLGCGDGELQGAFELCDDGNMVDEDDCSNECIPSRTVFVTDSVHTGELGGITGADEICRNAAMSKNLGAAGSTWMAWLSADAVTPASRMDTLFKGWYRLPSGKPIAKGWAGLIDGSLDAPLNENESGAVPADAVETVWTNTAKDGTTAGDNDCGDWKTKPNESVVRGRRTSTDMKWTNDATAKCTSSLHLYCFEN